MKASVVCFTAVLVSVAGCVGPVEIAPLPYAHPANPDSPPGVTLAVGTALAPDPACEPRPADQGGRHDAHRQHRKSHAEAHGH